MMKSPKTLFQAFSALIVPLLLVSCQKNNADVITPATETSANVIAVAATARTASTAETADSIYVVQPCSRGEHRDSIGQSALPATVTDYINNTYAGATFSKAFALVNSSGTTTGYVVIIYNNNTPVGLLFDAGGTFVRVLEQRERGDLQGPGWHHGGRFQHRDGQGRDSLALGSLPASATSYMSANYPADTLLKAFTNHDSTIVIISQNNGLFATVFTSTGTFVNRVALPARNGHHTTVAAAALPAPATNYLAQTYPGYVFEKAFSVSDGSGVREYIVIIDANNTKYAVSFDASGNFLHARTIH